MRAKLATFLLRLALAASAGLLPWACIIGGTGTDTENGIVDSTGSVNLMVSARVVDSGGRPVRDVTLSLRAPGFRPDSGAAPEQSLDSARELRTDAAGFVKFRVARAGKYVVEGSRQGTVLFYDTLAVADSQGRADYTFRGQPPRNFQGTVKLASGLRVDSGVIFIRGTGRWARLMASGAYDLGSLPAQVALMSVGLRYSASPLQFRVAEQKTAPLDTTKLDTTKPANLTGSFSCRVITSDSAAKLPSYAATLGPDRTSTSPTTLDSAHVKAAAGSCDSLQTGTVVTVKLLSPKAGPITLDSAKSASYLAVSAGGAAESSPKLVPLQGCVAAPGAETTSFQVQLQPAGAGADALVGDVSGACLSAP
jgi:hypothetical protein